MKAQSLSQGSQAEARDFPPEVFAENYSAGVAMFHRNIPAESDEASWLVLAPLPGLGLSSLLLCCRGYGNNQVVRVIPSLWSWWKETLDGCLETGSETAEEEDDAAAVVLVRSSQIKGLIND